MDTSVLSQVSSPLTTSDGRLLFFASRVELKCYSLSRLDAIQCAEFAAMHHINKTKENAPSGAWLTSDLTDKAGKKFPRYVRGLQRKTSRRCTPLASWVAACLLLFSPSLPVHGGWLKPDIDFSNYDVPLYDQI